MSSYSTADIVMKLCKDCDHFTPERMGISAMCDSPDVAKAEVPHVFAVHGYAMIPCSQARMDGHGCGLDGKCFTPARQEALTSWFVRLLKDGRK